MRFVCLHSFLICLDRRLEHYGGLNVVFNKNRCVDVFLQVCPKDENRLFQPDSNLVGPLRPSLHHDCISLLVQVLMNHTSKAKQNDLHRRQKSLGFTRSVSLVLDDHSILKNYSGAKGVYGIPSLKLTEHLKIGGWKMNFLLRWPIFRGYVSFREGNSAFQVFCYEHRGHQHGVNGIQGASQTGRFAYTQPT